MRLCLNIREQLRPDIAVDGRDTERLPVGKLQVPAACNRLRRPVTVQAGNDEIPCFRAGAQRRTAMISAALDGEGLRPPVIVPIGVIRLPVWFPLCFVPLDLTADRRGTAFQNGRDLSQTVAFMQKFL